MLLRWMMLSLMINAGLMSASYASKDSFDDLFEASTPQTKLESRFFDLLKYDNIKGSRYHIEITSTETLEKLKKAKLVQLKSYSSDADSWVSSWTVYVDHYLQKQAQIVLKKLK